MCERENIARRLVVDYLSRGDDEMARISLVLKSVWDVDECVPPGYQNLESLIAELPTDECPEILLETGNAALASGEYDVAIERFSRYLERWETDNAVRLKRCSALMKQSNFEDAIVDLKSITEIEPGNAVAWAKLVLALWNNARYEEARSTYDKAVLKCHDSTLTDLSVLLGRSGTAV